MGVKIISYNVNGLRAAIRKGLVAWLKAVDADIVCLQEVKAVQEDIDPFLFGELGYYDYWATANKRGYSGTVILSRKKPDRVQVGIGIPAYDNEGRVIRADFGDLSVFSVYVPSGSQGPERLAFKLQFLEAWSAYIQDFIRTRPHVVLAGDFNVCHQSIDLHNPVANQRKSGFLEEERTWMGHFLNHGLIDAFRHLNPEPHHYSWWSFRGDFRKKNLGWRIDYIFVGKPLESRLQRAMMLKQAKHSDHCPVMIQLAELSVS